jgi:hypothetical protein
VGTKRNLTEDRENEELRCLQQENEMECVNKKEMNWKTHRMSRIHE